jgi:hypothetical protein
VGFSTRLEWHYPIPDIEINISGFSMMFEPPTTETFASFVRRLWQAKCRAVRAVEHPVSTVILGPLKSKKCERRFEIIAAPLPVRKYRGKVSGSLDRLS